MMTAQKRFMVESSLRLDSGGIHKGNFGPFVSREQAEQCVMSLSCRAFQLDAQISVVSVAEEQ